MEGVNLPTDISNFYCQIFLAKAMVARTQVQWKIKDGGSPFLFFSFLFFSFLK